MPHLPANPSIVYLRKEAKRLAKRRAIKLAYAQRLIAIGYGFGDWAMLVAQLESPDAGGRESTSALIEAVGDRNIEAVRSALADGANPRRLHDGETPLHAAARSGPLTLVEALIEGGAFDWQRDAHGRTALDHARLGHASDRDAIVALLDREHIADRAFRAAVAMIHTGDVAALELLMAAEPRLLVEPIIGPAAYRKRRSADYFRDPKLFWYVANNPTTVEPMAPNIVDVARAMLERGVDPEDRNYTLELVMSSSSARVQGHQVPLMRALLAGGAIADRNAIVVAAAHGERESLRELLACGAAIDAPIAAALGDTNALTHLLPTTPADDVTLAFGLAVINREREAAIATLEAGANVDAFLPVHSHSTPLHHAAANDDAEMIELLLKAGARSDIRDTLWDGTPLEWARYEKNRAAELALST